MPPATDKAPRSLAAKLGYKPAMSVLLLDLPAGMPSPFADIPHTSASAARLQSPLRPPDLVLAFTPDQATLARTAALLLPALTQATLLWVAYPKKSGAIKTDLSRDHGWDPLIEAGWIVIAVVSIDSTWSAVRFRPRHLVSSIRQGPATGVPA